VALVAFGLSPLFYACAALAVFSSAMIPLMNAHSQAIWQTQTPHELQGRVFAVRRLIAQCSGPLGAAVAGAAGGLMDPGWLIAALGAVLTAFCLAQLFNPALLRFEG
jgi:hypothetical protein